MAGFFGHAAPIMSKTYEWAEGTPIYRQLMQLLLAGILDGTFKEGDMLPSVRQLASDYKVNPLTVAKAFQELAIEELAEKRRGVGFIVKAGVRQAVQRRERARFLREEWPQIKARMERLGIAPAELLKE